MANVSIQDVKELRDMTGCGLSDCKKALEDANGNRDEAVKILREMGLAKSAKKAGRIAAEGIVKTKVDGSKGIIVEINCETDFAAKSDRFLELVETITDTILNSDVNDVDALMNVTASGTSQTVSEYLAEKIGVISENIKIRRFDRMEGTLIQYMHDGGRIGTLLKISTDKPDDAEILTAAKNAALQITAMNAQYVAKADIPADVMANEKEVQTKLVEQEGKPANVAEKIVEGRLRKFAEEVCLLEQTYFKDNTTSVGKYLDSVAKAQGAALKIEGFVRYERGEGIEKKADNFADEVASMIK
ncbi:MAG: translation elongation factor Ts [Oscillospiraceae bacterium]|nr:translation elongation factor Ts [Oscillospiraceae bacterium]